MPVPTNLPASGENAPGEGPRRITAGLKPSDNVNVDAVLRQRAPREPATATYKVPQRDFTNTPVEEPRPYQRDLLELAKQENIIAVMDTGTGKTLIAGLLMKHMIAVQEESVKEGAKKKLALFLVPTVPLVWQQKDYLKHQISKEIACLCGNVLEQDKLVDWQEIIQKHVALCSTAQVVVEALNHAYLTLDQVSLIIFDEAHNAIGDHPYAILMREHYWPVKEPRPKILGLTASPVNSDSQAFIAIDNLEKTLNCRAVTVTLSDEATALYAAKPRPVKFEYEVSDSMEMPPILEKAKEYVSQVHGFNLAKAIADAEYIHYQLGSWACSRTLMAALDGLSKKADRSILNSMDVRQAALLAGSESKRRTLFEDLSKYRPADSPTDAEISRKVHRLMDILEGYRRDASFSGIVFVQRRETAERLRDLLASHPRLKGSIRPGALIGHASGTADEYYTTMRLTVQNTTLREFRQHKINLLVATKVAEEGLDIPCCKLVIRFNMGKDSMNLVNYIQSRGRARAANSRFILMCEKDNWMHLHHLRALREQEREVRAQIEKHRDRIETRIAIPQLDEADTAVTKSVPYSYIIESTGARVSLTSASPTLHHFCSILEVDMYTVARPEYALSHTVDDGDVQFVATVVLPNVLPPEMRIVLGHPMRSKALAFRSAALEAVKLLHQKKYLDNHLRPIFDTTYCHTSVEDADVATLKKELLALKSKQRKAKYPIALPECLIKCWVPEKTATITAHLNVIDTAGFEGAPTCQPLGFLTVNPLPVAPFEFPIWPNLLELRVRVQTTSKPFALTRDQYKLAKKYNFLVLSPMMKHTIFPEHGEYAFLAVPLTVKPGGSPINVTEVDADTLVDWESMDKACNFEPRQHRSVLYNPEVINEVVVSTKHWQRKFLVQEFLPDRTPFDEVPFTDPKFKRTVDYYTTMKDHTKVRVQQPVIRANLVTRKFNMLAYHNIAQSESVDALRDGDVFLMPQFLQPYSIKKNVLESATILPSIFYYLEIACRAEQLRQNLALPTKLDTLITALSAPSAVLQTNYERLETLGDAFLKIAIVLHMYALHPHRHEGVMTMMAHRMQSNFALYEKGKLRNITGYMITSKLARTEWRPIIADKGYDDEDIETMLERAELEDENAHNNRKRVLPKKEKEIPSAVTTTHGLSTKQIADSVESILGACLNDNGIKGAAQALHNVYSTAFVVNWEDYMLALDQHPKPAGEMRIEKRNAVAHVEEIIGYKFKSPWLLAEALTHPSSPDPTVQNYQRLEFLGDAILGLLAVRYFFRKYPELPPGRLVDLKDAAVNNAFLACVSANMGLHYHIDRLSAPMDQDIADYCDALWIEAKRHTDTTDARRAKLDLLAGTFIESKVERNNLQREMEAEMHYWTNIETPKAISDVFEAITGAIFVDNRFDAEAVWAFLERVWLPWVAEFVQPHFVGRHPFRELALFFRNEMGCDKWRVPARHDSEGHAYVANLVVHEQILAVAQGPSKKAARRIVSELVLDTMDDIAKRVKAECDCRGRRVERPKGDTVEDTRDDDDEPMLEKDEATMHAY
ncbi:uncharacterized protein EV422DRAFT_183138 [Fimicolochytrium jonesii]|uniref:uncharacterized protein n=1 Tax=Fimicolochytrium jonesii TaxID=1396493 RepID=UPI0022FE2649|nr:uncharacterized protein EV422DRAFT_183138 [Fimicolochytrium jonesii]KAI8818373.1 hypothetical protein EV422DRAFT_183138 [Fimicolochytrium jonesii]